MWADVNDLIQTVFHQNDPPNSPNGFERNVQFSKYPTCPVNLSQTSINHRGFFLLLPRIFWFPDWMGVGQTSMENRSPKDRFGNLDNAFRLLKKLCLGWLNGSSGSFCHFENDCDTFECLWGHETAKNANWYENLRRITKEFASTKSKGLLIVSFPNIAYLASILPKISIKWRSKLFSAWVAS